MDSPYEDNDNCKLCMVLETKGFLRWRITLKVIGVLDFDHRPEFLEPGNITFQEGDLFRKRRVSFENSGKWSKSNNQDILFE
jgi:hypothetical protein